MKNKLNAADRIYNKAIASLVDRTKQWGYTVELAKRYSKRVGKPIFRQTIDSWLHREPGQRKHPCYGNVVLLLMAAEDADRVFVAKAAKKVMG